MLHPKPREKGPEKRLLFVGTLQVHKLCQCCSRWPAEGARTKAVKGWELVQLVAGRGDAGWDLAAVPLSPESLQLQRSARWWWWVGGCWGHDFAMVHLKIPLPRPRSETVLCRCGVGLNQCPKGIRESLGPPVELLVSTVLTCTHFSEEEPRLKGDGTFPRSHPGHIWLPRGALAFLYALGVDKDGLVSCGLTTVALLGVGRVTTRGGGKIMHALSLPQSQQLRVLPLI